MITPVKRDGNPQVGKTLPLGTTVSRHNAAELRIGNDKPLGIIPAFYNSETQRFSGAECEFWPDFLDRFEVLVFECCKLSESEALRFLPVALTGCALAFYRLNIHGEGLQYENAIKLLTENFHDANRQRRIWHRIRNIRFEMYLDGKCTIPEAYEFLIGDLYSLFPQTALVYQNDAFKRDSLEKACIGHEWFSYILARPLKELPTFTALNRALAHAAQHYVETLFQQDKKKEIYGVAKLSDTSGTTPNPNTVDYTGKKRKSYECRR